MDSHRYMLPHMKVGVIATFYSHKSIHFDRVTVLFLLSNNMWFLILFLLSGQEKAAQLLLENGANDKLLSSAGETALMVAKQKGNNLNKFANLSNSFSASFQSRYLGHKNIVDILEKAATTTKSE